jgi:hypothetical protein
LTGASFVLTGINDLLVESGEAIVLDISGVLNAVEFGTQTQTVTVLDDDSAEVLLTVDTGAINENGGVAVFTLATSGDIISDTGIIVTFDYSGTAINGVDYITGTTSVIIPAFTTGTTFVLTGLDDLLVESNESIVVEVSSVINASEA